jgi:hypothetical protein
VIGYTTLTVIALALLAVGGLSLWAVFAGNGGA